MIPYDAAKAKEVAGRLRRHSLIEDAHTIESAIAEIERLRKLVAAFTGDGVEHGCVKHEAEIERLRGRRPKPFQEALRIVDSHMGEDELTHRITDALAKRDAEIAELKVHVADARHEWQHNLDTMNRQDAELASLRAENERLNRALNEDGEVIAIELESLRASVERKNAALLRAGDWLAQAVIWISNRGKVDRGLVDARDAAREEAGKP